MAAAERVKAEGAENDLLSRLAEDPLFAPVHDRLDALLDPALYIGRAPQQVEEFVAQDVDPLLHARADLLVQDKVELKV